MRFLVRSGVNVMVRKTFLVRIFQLIKSHFTDFDRQLVGYFNDFLVHLVRIFPGGQRHPVTGVGDRNEMEVHQCGETRIVYEIGKTVYRHFRPRIPVRVQHEGLRLHGVELDPIGHRIYRGYVHVDVAGVVGSGGRDKKNVQTDTRGRPKGAHRL